MSIKVKFFASIREELGTGSLDLDLDLDGGGPINVSGLIAQLTSTREPVWQQVLTAENIRVAINQTMTLGDVDIADGDEVAFFPPVTGG